MHTQKLPAPIVLIAPSGEDSLLVYTYENILYHYVMSVSNATVTLVQVGQIALHGIIRAPTRVRALSWILPEDQIRKSIDVFLMIHSAYAAQTMETRHKMFRLPPYYSSWTASSFCSSPQRQRVVSSSTRCESLRRT